MISATLNLLALAIYLLAAVFYGAGNFLASPAAPTTPPKTDNSVLLTRLGRPLLWAGVLLQFTSIGFWCMTTHRSPFASEYGTLATTAWAVAIAAGLLDIRARMPAVSALALGVVCLVQFWGLMHVRGPVAETPLLEGQMVSVHVMAILASFGLLAVAFVCAVLYLIQNRLLKARNVTGLFRRLPPLETLDRTAYRAVAYALPLLTLGLLLGFLRVFGKGIAQSPAQWLTDPHTIVSLATWGIYIFYLTTRLAAGWRGIRLQYVLLLGLPVALVLYVIPTSTHRFG